MNIALMARDRKKELMVQFCIAYCGILAEHSVCATNTTGKLVSEATGLPVTLYLHADQGGAQQIGARIAEGDIDLVIFFSDPLTAQPHDPDVKALLRIAQVYDIPIANNRATADFIISSPLMEAEYSRMLLNFKHNIDMRAQTL